MPDFKLVKVRNHAGEVLRDENSKVRKTVQITCDDGAVKMVHHTVVDRIVRAMHEKTAAQIHDTLCARERLRGRAPTDFDGATTFLYTHLLKRAQMRENKIKKSDEPVKKSLGC